MLAFVDAPGFRITWQTEVGTLSAFEPTLAEVSQHAGSLAAGYNEPVNMPLLGHGEKITETEVVDHYEGMFEDKARPFLLFRDDKFVDDADLRGIRDGACEFAFMIGAPSEQGKGLGTRFAIMINAFGFSQLSLDRIFASIVPANVASRRVFDKLGYRVDDGELARTYADQPGDITMVIDRPTFERVQLEVLGQLQIGMR